MQNPPPYYSKVSDSFNQNVGEPCKIELIIISMPGCWYQDYYRRLKNINKWKKEK